MSRREFLRKTAQEVHQQKDREDDEIDGLMDIVCCNRFFRFCI